MSSPTPDPCCVLKQLISETYTHKNKTTEPALDFILFIFWFLCEKLTIEKAIFELFNF